MTAVPTRSPFTGLRDRQWTVLKNSRGSDLLMTASRHLLLWLIGRTRTSRKAIVVALDLLMCLFAVWIGYSLRLGEWELFSDRVWQFAALAEVAWIAIALLTGTYRSVTRYADGHSLRSLATSCMLLSACLASVLLWAHINGVPRTLAVIHPIVFFLGMASARLILSRLVSEALSNDKGEAPAKRILIYGAGFSAQQLAGSVSRDPAFRVVGFVDQNLSMRKSLLQGKPIWHTSDLELVLRSAAVDEVVLAIPSMNRRSRRAVVEAVAKCSGQVKVRSLPTISQLASGRVTVSDLRDVQIEELLGRDEVAPDPLLMGKNITGRSVLVTGAGGSIGSELCRQIILHRPAAMVLAEQCEFALYKIEIGLAKLRSEHGIAVELCPELVNVADEQECERLFGRHQLDTVFHAAAYKHVPLVESNPVAGIRNNVLGTLNTALASERSGVRKFILVSTDKAVRPSNVMGATKRACELIVQARAAVQDRTSFCSVRFGNVLGSSGSVIPLFREQIAAGGPVTVTHHEATRYFMTIPEAAQLVVQAGAIAEDGEILLLDMGEPVRIIDLARLMIELSGLTVSDELNPDGDIVIQEIGLRPGEKMVEELLIGGHCESTVHPRIVKAREAMIGWNDLEPMLRKLSRGIERGDASAAINALRQLVPEFKSAAASAPAVPVHRLQSRVTNLLSSARAVQV